MISTLELIAAAKAANDIPSNYRLARILDIPEKTLARWTTGRNKPDDLYTARLAELAGLDVGQVVASIHADRAEPGPVRDLWIGIASRLARTSGAAAAVAFMACYATSAEGEKAIDPGVTIAGLYIMSNGLLKIAARLCTAWRTRSRGILPLQPVILCR